MSYFTAGQLEPFFGKISLIAGLSNFLLIGFFVLLERFNSKLLIAVIFLAFAVSLAAGLGTGIAAFIYKRAWLGLALNFLMIALISVSFYFYFALCCAPIPTAR